MFYVILSMHIELLVLPCQNMRGIHSSDCMNGTITPATISCGEVGFSPRTPPVCQSASCIRVHIAILAQQALRRSTDSASILQRQFHLLRQIMKQANMLIA